MCVVKGFEAMGGAGGLIVRGVFISCSACSFSSDCSGRQCLLGFLSGDGSGDGRLKEASGDSGMTETGLSKESGANRAGARGGSCGRLFPVSSSFSWSWVVVG